MPVSLRRRLTLTKLKLLSYDVTESNGIITFSNKNTTLGFVRYSESGDIEYIFVQPMYRKQGLAKKLLQMVEEKTQKQLNFLPPISKLGQSLINSYRAGSSMVRAEHS